MIEMSVVIAISGKHVKRGNCHVATETNEISEST